MEQIYFFCAIFGSLFVVAQLFLSLFTGFGAEDGSADAVDADGAEIDTDHSGVDFLRVLSIRTITAGLAFFGLAGMAGTRSKMGTGIVFGIAVVSGLAALFFVFFLYRLISSFKSDGSVTVDTLRGSKGNVYVRIPPTRSGSGKVIVNHQGRSMEYEAFTDAERELKSGEPITVKDVLSPNQVLVEPSSLNDAENELDFSNETEVNQ